MGADTNTQGGEYSNALQAAAYEGYQEIVQLLLYKGADINAQGGFYGNALQAAVSEGLQDIVQLLLGKGADINAQGGRYNNALQAAHQKEMTRLRNCSWTREPIITTAVTQDPKRGGRRRQPSRQARDD
ncbi:ankyrin repeat-containing domain protein [Aspergillus terricola var. indicus]